MEKFMDRLVVDGKPSPRELQNPHNIN